MEKVNLIDINSDKRRIISLRDKTVITENIKGEKAKITEKEFSSKEEAKKQYLKKGWESLKKGFIARNENVEQGKALLHYFVGGYHTGALSFAETPKGIYVYKCEEEKDYLLLLDGDGNLKDTIELPQILAWDIIYQPSDNSLLMDLDHNIYRYALEDKEFDFLMPMNQYPVSFISISNNNVAYGVHPLLKIEDKDGNIQLEQSFDAKILKGSFPFNSVLSQNGKILALHNEEGKVQLLDSASGRVIKTIENDFPTVERMEFADNDRTLVLQETHGKWKIRFFDVATGAEIICNGLEIPDPFNQDTTGFCFNEDKSILVKQFRERIYVYDYTNRKFLYTFELEHCVRSSNMKFVGNLLGVRTDYGCFSLYRI